MKDGYFPSVWKSTFINPLFKKGNKNLISNYRPISLISIIPKIFSKIVNSKLIPLFKNIFVTQQHGFRSQRSTVTNLISFKHFLLDSLSKGEQTDVIYTDFEKAFDRIDHSLLVMKLKKIGFTDPLLSWFHSFLTQRTQHVIFKEFIFKPIIVTSGVPQEDHLSPLLFNLFINDIVFSIKYSNILLLADDAKIFKSVKSPSDSDLLQKDLNNFYDWCAINGMSLNITKCQSISFFKIKNPIIYNYSFFNLNLSRCSLIKDLGIFFDSKLFFNHHVLSIKNKALSMFGLIKRNYSKFNDPITLKCLYTSLIRSQLEYATIIWESHNIGHSKLIEGVQNNVLRYICFKCNIVRPPHSGYNDILNFLNLKSLQDRRIDCYYSFLKKLLNNKIDNNSFLLGQIKLKIHIRNTRDTCLFHIPYCSQNYTSSSPINTLLTTGNNVNRDLDKFLL